MKSVLIIYDTKFGNTKQLAEEIAAGIEEAGEITCKVENINEFDRGEVADIDAVLFGCPVHALRATRGIQRAIKKAAKDGLDGKMVTTFETYMGSHNTKAISGMESTLRKKASGAKILSPGFSALVDGYEGPLHAAHIPKARSFGEQFGVNLLSA